MERDKWVEKMKRILIIEMEDLNPNDRSLAIMELLTKMQEVRRKSTSQLKIPVSKKPEE